MATERTSPEITRYAGVIHTLTAAEASTLDAVEINGRQVVDVPKKLGRQFRRGQASYDKDSRTVTMAASSSTPVERYYGQEILSHDKGALRTNRLDNGVSLLFNHDYDQLLGRSQSYEVGDPLRVTAKFGTSDLARQMEAEVEANILRDVSIGYLVHEWEITEDKNGVRTYLAVDWELLEVSLVTVPADPTVGVGRDAKDAVPVKVRSFRSAKEEDDEDDEDEEDDTDPDDEDDEGTGSESARSTTPDTTQQRTAPTMADITPGTDFAAENKARVEGLRSIRSANPDFYTEDALLNDIAGGTDVRSVKDKVADQIIASRQGNKVPTLGTEVVGSMSEREAKEYSLRNVYAAAVNRTRPGTFTDKGAEAGFEREVDQELRKQASARGYNEFGAGIVVPSILPLPAGSERGFSGQRTVAAGSGNVGPNSIVPTIQPGIIELLRARTVVLASGAHYMSGLFGQPRFLRQNATGFSNWVAEGGQGSNSDPGLDFFGMSPKRLTMQQSYFMEFLAQSPVAVEGFLRDDRVAVQARSIDQAGIAGPGTNNTPLGLLGQTGLAAILPGATKNAAGVVTPGAGGVPLTFVDINIYEKIISNANADISTMGWVFTNNIRADLRTTPKQPGYASTFIMPDSTPAQDGVQEGPLGYRSIASAAPYLTGFSAQIGGQTVNNLDACILGVWSQMLIGDWGLNEVIADNITGAAQGLFKITENGLYDINFRHIPSFAASTTVAHS